MVHLVVPIHRVFSFRIDCNIRSHNIIQSIPCSSILGGQLFIDGFHGPVPVLAIYHRLLISLLETHFTSLLVTVAADQN
jgi:hypothetical protein